MPYTHQVLHLYELNFLLNFFFNLQKVFNLSALVLIFQHQMPHKSKILSPIDNLQSMSHHAMTTLNITDYWWNDFIIIFSSYPDKNSITFRRFVNMTLRFCGRLERILFSSSPFHRWRSEKKKFSSNIRYVLGAVGKLSYETKHFLRAFHMTLLYSRMVVLACLIISASHFGFIYHAGCRPKISAVMANADVEHFFSCQLCRNKWFFISVVVSSASCEDGPHPTMAAGP